MPPDWPQLLLACIADDTAGAKTLAEFSEHRARRAELIAMAGRYAQSKGWRRVKLDGGTCIAAGEHAWTDFLFNVMESQWIGEALLELDAL